LTTLARKIELVEHSCPSIRVVVREFTEAFANQSPGEFAERVLARELCCRVVMVGLNFRFGRGRAGDIHQLERLGARLGFEAVAEPLVSDADGAWSSTRVRGLVAAGDVGRAATILGRPHMLAGTVTRGDQRGRRNGFPTCNISDAREALPPFGVYAVLVDQVDGDPPAARALAKGVANIGVRPTVQSERQAPAVEVHLFDIDRDLYGRELRVHLVERLRDEQRFADLQTLVAQIGRDADRARQLLADHEPEHHDAWA
jgi:riboflavin kinase/FMN adenylyltransferase